MMIWKSYSSYRCLGIAILLIFLSFTTSAIKTEAQFPLTNAYIPYQYFTPFSPLTIYPNPIDIINSQTLQYQDYYAAYPYLQQQNWTTSNTNSSNTYIPNATTYVPGYSIPANYTNTYNPSINYPSTSSSTYQTVSIYPSSGSTNNQIQTQYTNTGTYPQNYIPAQNYFPVQSYIPVNPQLPAIQSTFYPNALPQFNPVAYNPYLPNLPITNLPQPLAYNPYQPNIYLPSNPYQPNITPYSNYYVPNANYWPNVEIELDPADIEGEYKGEWESTTTGDDGELCAEIEQDETEIDGEIKLKEYVIEVEGKADLTGTVNGDTVTIEIDLDGPTLEFVGTVQSNGDITGTYTVTGSSVLDEGTITFEPK